MLHMFIVFFRRTNRNIKRGRSILLTADSNAKMIDLTPRDFPVVGSIYKMHLSDHAH